MTKTKFYLLSFTWGLPLTLIGLLVALVLLSTGHKPKKWGLCWYFEIGKGWGGLELGVVFLTSKTATEHTKNHELGHAIQNTKYGFAMPFIVCVPSAVRYWVRKFQYAIGKPPKTKYDDIWFEGEATALGNAYMN
jgi:hypothetical protein